MNSKHPAEEWYKLAPNLAQLEKKNPIRVPEGYFENLTSRIQEKTIQQTVQKNRFTILPLWTRYAAAACVTVGLVITGYLNLRQEEQTIDWNSIPEQEIVAYLELHLDDSDASLVLDQLEPKQTQVQVEQVSNQELETYLNQHL